jgi:opacity protein-like surface antigen
VRHAFLAALLLSGAVRASAQTDPPADPPAPRPFSFDISGGGVVPLGAAGDASGLGWNVGVSAGVAVRGRFSVRALYLYSRFAAKEIQVPVEVDGPQPLTLASLRGKVQSHTGFFDLVAGWPSAGGRRSFYVMAGPLVAGRRVSITGSGPTAAAFDACLPQWLQCSPTTVSFDRALGIRRAASVGASVGAGASFDVGLAARLVIETRYMYLDGPSFTDVNGARQSASATYLPVSIGLRF